MAGPGGGGHGGGGFGGGSFGGGGGGFSGGGGFGGGNHGGSFGGGPGFGGPHHHGPHHHGPHFHGPFFGGGWGGYHRGGCGGNLIGVIVIAMFVLFGFFWMIGEPLEYDYVVNGEPEYIYEDGIIYDEVTMQDYANERYKEVFGDYEGYEDNILLVFLANEEADGYYTIAWVGDNIRYEINEMFGEYTEYGMFLSEYINEDYYAYSLDTNLAEVVSAMEKSITELQLDSSFNAESTVVEGKKSELINYTEFDLTKEVVNTALESFTAKTGIPCVIVVDMVEKVFAVDEPVNEVIVPSVDPSQQSTENVADSITFNVTASKIVIAIVAVVACVALIVAIWRPIKKKKQPSEDKKSKNDMPWES